MDIISYLRWWCRPTITNIYLRSTCWWWYRWLHVVLILINLILIISRKIILLHISTRSHRSINSSTNSLARCKREMTRSVEGCFDDYLHVAKQPSAERAVFLLCLAKLLVLLLILLFLLLLMRRRMIMWEITRMRLCGQ